MVRDWNTYLLVAGRFAQIGLLLALYKKKPNTPTRKVLSSSMVEAAPSMVSVVETVLSSSMVSSRRRYPLTEVSPESIAPSEDP